MRARTPATYTPLCSSLEGKRIWDCFQSFLFSCCACMVREVAHPALLVPSLEADTLGYTETQSSDLREKTWITRTDVLFWPLRAICLFLDLVLVLTFRNVGSGPAQMLSNLSQRAKKTGSWGAPSLFSASTTTIDTAQQGKTRSTRAASRQETNFSCCSAITGARSSGTATAPRPRGTRPERVPPAPTGTGPVPAVTAWRRPSSSSRASGARKSTR